MLENVIYVRMYILEIIHVCVITYLMEKRYIGSGAKIDNLVHIAHNLYVGKNAVITANVMLTVLRV